MDKEKRTSASEVPIGQINAFQEQIKNRSDRLMDYFLAGFFVVGVLLSFFYDTWTIGIGVGSLSLIAYYSVKFLLPHSKLYQYVLSIVYGIFMAQYIYQMHGLFEMHFIAFVGSTILITYQNWKLQIPLALLVVVHHALFGYLQYVGYDKIYFTQLDYMTLQTFIIHGLLATLIFFICGLWAHHFKKYSERHIEQTFEVARLQEEKLQKDTLRQSKDNLLLIVDLIPQAIFAKDYNGKYIFVNKSFADLYGLTPKQLVRKTMNDTIPALNNIGYFLDQDREVIDTGNTKVIPEMVFTDHKKETRIFYTVKVPYTHPGRNEKAVLGIAMDITDQKMAEAERGKMVTDIVQRNKDLEQFSYIVSHNLRAPVANIIGLSDLLQINEHNEEEEKIYMQSLTQSIGKLDSVIRDLNHILQVKHHMNEKKETLKFSQLCSDIQLSINSLLKSEHVKIITDFSAVDEMTTIKSYLYSIFFNLISNSIKYHKPGEPPVIEITATKEKNNIVLVFKDNGLGIDLQQKGSQVFGLYKRFHHHTEGKGMGLFMVKTQVETLGGSITIESEVNNGTKFKIVFLNN